MEPLRPVTTPGPEQKKEILNKLLREFILYPEGEVELRYKLPVNEKQVAESLLTLSMNVNTASYLSQLYPFSPALFRGNRGFRIS